MHIRKDVLNLTIPIFTEQTFIITMGVINAIMAGHIGKEAVSAIGMVDSVNNMFIAFFSALAVGATVVVAHFAGKRNNEKANEATKQALYSGFILAAAIALMTWVFRHVLISTLYGAAEQQVLNNAYLYLQITLLTYPLIAITSIAAGVLRGAGDTRTPAKVTLLMNVINIILSYLLIYGLDVRNSHLHIYIPQMGITGAALGIAAARITGSVIILFTLLKGSKIIRLDRLFSFRFDMELQKSIFGIGIPASIESMFFNIGKLITQIFIVGMGTGSIAANYIASSVFGIINVAGSSLSIAATTMVGQKMGSGESEEAQSILSYLVRFSTLCFLVPCTVAVIFSKPIVMMYTQDAEIIHLASNLIMYSALVTPLLWTLSFMLPAGLKGAGDVKYTMVTAIIGMWVFRITLGYILGIPLKFGVLGVWFGMFIDWLVRGILYYRRLKNGKWKNNVVIKSMEEAA